MLLFTVCAYVLYSDRMTKKDKRVGRNVISSLNYKIKMKVSNLRLKSLALVLGISCGMFWFLSGDASAATKTWVSAGTNVNWSTPQNWSPAGAPVDGDNINFSCANSGYCESIFDIPGLSVGTISFSGSLPGDVINLTNAPIVVNGGINSATIGSIFHGSVFLGANITVNNTVLGAVDLNGHNLTLTGKGVVNSSNGQTWLGIAGDITGDGTLVINADNDQEVYLAGENLYSGVTTISNGKFVSNGQNPNNHTLNMFGVSDIDVGPLGKVTFTFDQSETGSTFLNKITFNRTDNTLAQLLLINKSTNNSAISIGFSGVDLSSNTRFDVDIGGGALSINLAGIIANSYCVEYGLNNTQSTYFMNGPTCTNTTGGTGNNGIPKDPNSVVAPKTGVVAGVVIVTSVVTAAAGTGLSLRNRRSLVKSNSEK